jgi:hypothetical protein
VSPRLTARGDKKEKLVVTKKELGMIKKMFGEKKGAQGDKKEGSR